MLGNSGGEYQMVIYLNKRTLKVILFKVSLFCVEPQIVFVFTFTISQIVVLLMSKQKRFLGPRTK